MKQIEVCNIGATLRRSDGLEVKTGQSFFPTEAEVAAFGDLFISVAMAKEKGIYEGPADSRAELESVDAACKRIQAEEAAIAERRGRAIAAPSVVANPPKQEEEQDEDNEDEDNEDEDDDKGAAPTAGSIEIEKVTLDQLKTMKIPELKTFAEQVKVDISGLRSKDEIVAALAAVIATN